MTSHSPLITHVADWHGAPTLFINGRPDTGLMLYAPNPAKNREEIADFAEAGIDLLTTSGLGSVSCLREDGSFDMTALDANMERILAANPRALILNRMGLYAPTWWLQRHPGQVMQEYNPAQEGGGSGSAAFASDLWQEEMGRAMQQVIVYCEERYGKHMLGYHLGAGDCQEWSYGWGRGWQSDYSQVQVEAFRAWWRQKFGETSEWLTIEIPRDWRRVARASSLFDSPQDRVLREYMLFHSQIVAGAIVKFARKAKEALRSIGRQKIVAVFYGYHFTPPNLSSAFFNSGHHALDPVLASPDIDVLCAPYSYYRREAGGTYFSQLPAGSVRLRGKLFYSEEDTVTHISSEEPDRYRCPDLKTTQNVLLRNTLGPLRDGGTSWYMDWLGKNWFRENGIMDSIAATQRLARVRLEFENASLAQIAVIVSGRTPASLRYDGDLINAWAIEQMSTLWQIGAPLDVYRMEDLGLMMENGKLQPYRLLIFLDVPSVSQEERKVVHRAATGGRTFLWTYAPGLVTDTGLSVEALSELIGIRARIETDGGPFEFTPALAGDDPEAELIVPNLLRKWQATHTAYWNTTPRVPHLELLRVAREAGVHIYSPGDQVLAENQMLVVHAASTGEREIVLPHRQTVEEAFTGRIIVKKASSFRAHLELGQTAVWLLR